MSVRYDCLSPRPNKDGKVFWHKVGTAFESRDGGMQVYLESLPLPDKEGRVSFIIRQAKDLREASGTGSRREAPQRQAAEIDDTIPF